MNEALLNTQSSDYQAVAPAYKTYLRIHTSITLFIFIAVAVAVRVSPIPLPNWIPHAVIAALLVLWLVLIIFWVPRRYAVTQYYVADDETGFRVGALWHKEVTVTFNRLQHIELARGPIERWLGISRLMLYTAGGQGADLSLPGLPEDDAENLKRTIVERVRAEQLSDDVISEVGEQVDE
ncbi:MULTISPECIES: PH domain-containing protein [Gammaproteobacteria]|uniref:PH domain-containing protein n=1 Tax=Gammaproteobacteria TaxID=1236 RepID=UPI000DD045EE|nr:MULTISPECIES: PH domain-containing protein [Gammaproteobacteria]RTE85782.1 hypothetical protein DQX04_10045 [Aliidiomarina sp. B3213]TCZ90215.1 hypothetical protein EYQ95_10410 [Lysobacter sp. N42]